MTFFKWSRTAASNATADTTCPFPEGMAASALNDGTRGMMAAAAKYRDDTAGAIVTGGTLNAYTVASFQGFGSLSDLSGEVIAFSPHVTNGDTVTLAVDGTTAKPLRSAPGVELVAGTLVQGTPYVALYNNSDGAYYLHGFFSSPYNVPFLGGLDFWDTVTPNSGFIFPAGQAISRTVYSKAFARWGTTFGAGDGSTTFNVPDKTERVSVMKAASASRLTATYFGGNSTVLGAVGGGESQTLSLAQLPTGINSTNSLGIAVSVVSSVSNIGQGSITSVQNGASGVPINPFANGASASAVTSTGTLNSGTVNVTSNNTGGGAHPIVQPTIVCNYIIRVL